MNCRRVPVAFITCGSNRQGCLGFRASYQSSFKFEPSIVAVISAVGGLDLEEWALLRRVLGLIKECAPRHSGNAHGRLGTIRLCAVQACHVRRQRWRVAFSFHVRQSGGGTMSRWNLKRALVAHWERVPADSRSRSAVLVQSPLEAVGSLSELKLLSWLCLQTRFRQILEGARIVDRLVAKLLQRFSNERRAPA